MNINPRSCAERWYDFPFLSLLPEFFFDDGQCRQPGADLQEASKPTTWLSMSMCPNPTPKLLCCVAAALLEVHG